MRRRRTSAPTQRPDGGIWLEPAPETTPLEADLAEPASTEAYLTDVSDGDRQDGAAADGVTTVPTGGDAGPFAPGPLRKAPRTDAIARWCESEGRGAAGAAASVPVRGQVQAEPVGPPMPQRVPHRDEHGLDRPRRTRRTDEPAHVSGQLRGIAAIRNADAAPVGYLDRPVLRRILRAGI